MPKLIVLLLFVISAHVKPSFGGILQARTSETRAVVPLGGLWYFTANSNFSNNIREANDLDINLMPVPSSYNDITTRLDIRDHVGPVWYERDFYIPSEWCDKRVWIRFGSVCYNASVTINNEIVVTHQIGHLPFSAEVTSVLNFGKSNTITVTVNNILTETTIPQGSVETLLSGKLKETYTFDFFNYAGIDRPVVLYTTSSKAYVDDVTIETKLDGTSGFVTYDLIITRDEPFTRHQVNILDKKGIIVASSSTQNPSETLTIQNANLWWPYLMDLNPGYLYSLEVLVQQDNLLIDHYVQPFGIRQLKYDNDSFTINGKNIYIRGFGRHEDSDIRGKGLDLPLIIRDHNLIKWVGANAHRTSHYPYAEEIMDLADQLGIMIIDEVPAVNTEDFNNDLLENHKRSLTELYRRDKNRPSVVIWSIANEPRTQLPEAEDYYRQISAHIKSLDITRPITIANCEQYDQEYAGQFLDLLGFNRYQAWYNNVGEIDGIYERILDEARGWRTLHNKPVLMTEYGADSMEGLTLLPTYLWSEEFQLDVMEQYFRAFDKLRSEGWFIGEMIWNFADFKTDQNINRVGGNKKGIFTRSRQPKQAAFYLRKRYWALAHDLDNAALPDDVYKYITDSSSSRRRRTDL